MERCPYCFKPLPESGVCDCRYEESKNAQIEDALHPGAIVGACYQIGAVLGKGGFGITYKAFDLNMQKVVAIKEFYPDGMVTRGKLYGNITGSKISKSRVLTMSERSGELYQKSLELFYREAVALGKLDKLPNVVHAHHVFRENGTAYIVMEFVNGQSLKSMIEERGKIPEQELLSLLDPVLTVLGKVHQANILHRDIAPDNIMIENGNPVLLDFGAARLDDAHHSSLVIGKKGYSAPEQIAGGTVDQRSDIYAMGATYYAALSGITPQDSVLRMIRDLVVPLKDLGISPSVSDAVMKAMALNSEERWKNVAAFQQALKEQTERPSAKVQPPSEKKHSTNAAGSGMTGGEPPKKKPKTAIIAAAVLAVLAGGFFLFRGKIMPAAKTDPAALTQAAMDAELEKIAEVQTVMIVEQTAAAQKSTQNVINTEWAKVTETQEFIQTETARPTATSVPTNTPTALPDPDELYKKANSYYSQRDYQQALIYFELAAIQGHVNSQYFTGYLYERGMGTDKSYEKAIEWYQKAADQGHIISKSKVAELKKLMAADSTITPTPTLSASTANIRGEASYNNGNYDEAFEYFQIAADQGNPGAQNRLGDMYRDGYGVEQSHEKAFEWYQKAADQGNRWAQNNLGYMYEKGYGVEQSYEKAFELYQKAADQGNPWAQSNLGIMYENGYGVEQSYEKAFEWYQKAADRGIAWAQNNLGVMYENGYGVEQSYEKAFEWYQKAADQGIVWAQNNLGYLYEKGYGVDQSYEKALEWYQKAADQGHTAAKSKLKKIEELKNPKPTKTPRPAGTPMPVEKMADSFFVSWYLDIYNKKSGELAEKYFYEPKITDLSDNEEFVLVFFVYNKSSESLTPKLSALVNFDRQSWKDTEIPAGDSLYFYIKDHGSPGSYHFKFFINGEQAVEGSYTIHSDKDDASTPTNTPVSLPTIEKGIYYFEREEYQKAFEILLVWAEQGFVDAQLLLAYMYEHGQGVELSYEKALEWYRKSAEQGNDIAQNNLGFMYQLGEGVDQSNEKALDWFRKSAEQGNDVAQNNLGNLYRLGLGVEQSYKKALEWYQKSADQGNDDAQCNLGIMYGNGEEVEQSYEKALEWFQKSAEQGNAVAQNNLAYMYEHGQGVEKSYKKAIEWYQKAAEQGNTAAQFNLGNMYENGIGFRPSAEKAKEWYQKAADQGDEDAIAALERLR